MSRMEYYFVPSRNGFMMEDHRPLLKEAVMVLATRTSEEKSTQDPYKKLVK